MKVLANGAVRMPAEPEIDPLAVLKERAEARAALWAAGEFPDLPAAVDPLQKAAEQGGLTRNPGHDAVQKILADAFARYREKAAVTLVPADPPESDVITKLCPTCNWAPCLTPSFCRSCRKADAAAAQQRQQQRRQKPQARPTSQSTIEAIMWSIRERGAAALSEPDTVERLSRCDEEAWTQIDTRMTKLRRPA